VPEWLCKAAAGCSAVLRSQICVQGIGIHYCLLEDLVHVDLAHGQMAGALLIVPVWLAGDIV
jgi:hypothetical protein